MPILDFTIPFIPCRPKLNLTGRKFGRLLVLSIHSQDTNNGSFRWICKCECGKFTMTASKCLLGNNTTSCGCRHKDAVTIHGRSRSVEYHAWISIQSRCSNPLYHSFNRYGGRGIRCHIGSFAEFIEIVGLRPSPNYTLDRINNDGHYERGNLRWATRTEQQRNRETTVFLTAWGVTKPLAEWAGSNNKVLTKMRLRLRNGWCPECTVSLPNYRRCVHPRKPIEK